MNAFLLGIQMSNVKKVKKVIKDATNNHDAKSERRVIKTPVQQLRSMTIVSLNSMMNQLLNIMKT